MKITIVTGQSKAYYLSRFYKDESIPGGRYFFPENLRDIHPYDLMDRVMWVCDSYFKSNIDIAVFTYSKIVFDAIRLWAVKNKCTESVECISLMRNGDIVTSGLTKKGELLKQVKEIFDHDSFVSNELKRKEKYEDVE